MRSHPDLIRTRCAYVKLCTGRHAAALALGGVHEHAEPPEPGRAVQVDPIKPKEKPPGTKRLKLKCEILPSTFAFNSNLRRYNLVMAHCSFVEGHMLWVVMPFLHGYGPP